MINNGLRKHHAEEASSNNNTINKKYILKGLDCPNCAAKIEKKINSMENISSAELNFSSSILSVDIFEGSDIKKITSKIKELVVSLEPDVQVIMKSSNIASTLQEETAEDESPFNKKNMIKLILGSILFVVGLVFKFSTKIEFLIFFLSYILIGSEVLINAIKNIKRGEIFDENFLMVIATVGAFSIKEFPEAVAVMLFYLIGETFQDMAVNRSRKSIASLMDIRPDKANLKLQDGSLQEVSPEEVNIGDIIVVKPGEKIPLDGVILDGESMIDTSALTGESIPKKVHKDSEVLGGFINKNGVLSIKVTKYFSESTVSKILDLVQNAGSKKASTEKFITKFARYYTPIVVLSAIALALIPPVFIPGATFNTWLQRALIFLVVSCPCALVISIPLGFFGGIGAASKQGILIKGGNYLEALNSLDTVVFDKTGTLTKGVFELSEIILSDNIKDLKQDFKKDDLIKYAAYVESYSNHPIATSILTAYAGDIDKTLIKSYEEIPGHGVKSMFSQDEVLAGNYKLMEKFNINFSRIENSGTIVYIAINRKYAGALIISDKVKEDSPMAIENLKREGIKEIVMLTGDNKLTGENVAKTLNIPKVYTELLPQNKVEILEDICNSKNFKKKVAFVGDGVNDAPVLARADIGIAMGGLGSDAAIEAADIVIMTDEPSKIVDAIKIAKFTRKIVTQNIVFALGIKLLVLLLGALGIATMWEAVFADVGVALIAVMNSMRVLKSR